MQVEKKENGEMDKSIVIHLWHIACHTRYRVDCHQCVHRKIEAADRWGDERELLR